LIFKSSSPIITTHWTIIELTRPNKNLPNLYFPLIKIKSCKKKIQKNLPPQTWKQLNVMVLDSISTIGRKDNQMVAWFSFHAMRIERELGGWLSFPTPRKQRIRRLPNFHSSPHGMKGNWVVAWFSLFAIVRERKLG
jgi:hypothetical protein